MAVARRSAGLIWPWSERSHSCSLRRASDPAVSPAGGGGLLRNVRATANDAADSIAVPADAPAKLTAEQRARVLVRGDSGAGVEAFVHHLHGLGLHDGGGAVSSRAGARVSRVWNLRGGPAPLSC